MRRRSLPSVAEAAEILAHKRTRPPRQPPPVAGKALSKTMKALEERFGQSGPGVQVLRARWREIVGEMLGKRTEPVKLVRTRRGGPATLEIKVDGPAAALIQHQAPDILARVGLMLGSGEVDKLRIVQGPVRPPPSAKSPAETSAARRRRFGSPLDADAEARLAASLAEAPDNRLKTALLALGREVARRG